MNLTNEDSFWRLESLLKNQDWSYQMQSGERYRQGERNWSAIKNAMTDLNKIDRDRVRKLWVEHGRIVDFSGGNILTVPEYEAIEESRPKPKPIWKDDITISKSQFLRIKEYLEEAAEKSDGRVKNIVEAVNEFLIEQAKYQETKA